MTNSNGLASERQLPQWHRSTYPVPRLAFGSGANSSRQGVRLGSAWLSERRWAQAANAAFHNSDIVAFRPPTLSVLYCPFWNMLQKRGA